MIASLVPTDPVPMPRPKVTVRGGKPRAYVPDHGAQTMSADQAGDHLLPQRWAVALWPRLFSFQYVATLKGERPGSRPRLKVAVAACANGSLPQY